MIVDLGENPLIRCGEGGTVNHIRRGVRSVRRWRRVQAYRHHLKREQRKHTNEDCCSDSTYVHPFSFAANLEVQLPSRWDAGGISHLQFQAHSLVSRVAIMQSFDRAERAE
jgi:hypothetical protein